MGLYGIMNTSVSGMNAQANKLSTVADNIANVNTTGYKSVNTSFSSMVVSNAGGGSYNSGSVRTTVTQSVSFGGPIDPTSSGTDLAIGGSGFFIVNDANNASYLTRAGDFVINANGDLINTSGYYLQGYPIDSSGNISTSVNSTAGLENVNVSTTTMEAVATTEALLQVNLDSNANYSDVEATTFTIFDNVGNEVLLDVTYTKDAAIDNQWDMTVSEPSPGTGTSTVTLTFDPLDGSLLTPSPASLSLTTSGSSPQTIDFDLSGTTELAESFKTTDTARNGSAPSSIESVRIDVDGTLYGIFGNGQEEALYKIPLADVPSPDSLSLQSGNIYSVNNESGSMRIGFPGDSGFGDMYSGRLEASNVDLASQLTEMIQSQRSYSANSKVFSAGSDLLQELVNLR
ncbi:flagellar hook protein FlgE [Flexibacterium corallicola]|uniref:flagellar hook protein FlgE n=1 Tax=Flexibacterium corallicola TaxID=3037259 RepID=UPI00286EF4F6|nr:flagellar hook protein FlgE [Pseudovibrio sp. M1P-2-3]